MFPIWSSLPRLNDLVIVRLWRTIYSGDEVENDKKTSGTIDFHYIKSPSYQEIPVHGAYGGVNVGNGNFAMSVFSERGPVPNRMTYAIEGGELKDVVDREGKEGVVRSVQAVLHFDINTAIALHEWFGEKIALYSNANSKASDEEK